MVDTHQRFSREKPCPICGGSDSDPRGEGGRCFGFLSGDGMWVHCTREEHARGLSLNLNSQTYAHRLKGDCRCGVRHDGNGTEREEASKVVATYDYQDEQGKFLYQVVRYVPKTFKQRRPNGNGGWIWNLDGVRRVLYRLPKLLAADPSYPVFVPEGEKDVDNLRALEPDFIATTNPGGAGKWHDEYSKVLAGHGATVVLLPDNDEPGRKHALQVGLSLLKAGVSVKVIQLPGLPSKGDVSDWLAAGGTANQLWEFVAAASEVNSPETLSAALGIEVPAERKISFHIPPDLVAQQGVAVDWIVRPFVSAGTLTELVGKPKLAGKTTLLLQMARAVIQGNPFLGEPTSKAPVVYLSEEQRATFKQALERAGLIESPDLHFIFRHETLGLTWPQVGELAIEQCQRVGAGFLIVDTLPVFAGFKADEENKSGSALTAIEPLRAATAVGIGVMVVRHERKGSGEIGESGRGSTAFTGAADIILALGRGEGQTRPSVRVLKGISRLDGVPECLVIELTEQGFVSRGTKTQVDLEDAIAQVRDILSRSADDALTLIEMMEQLPDSSHRTTIQAAIGHLLRQQEARKEGKGRKGDPFRYWRP